MSLLEKVVYHPFPLRSRTLATEQTSSNQQMHTSVLITKAGARSGS